MKYLIIFSVFIISGLQLSAQKDIDTTVYQDSNTYQPQEINRSEVSLFSFEAAYSGDLVTNMSGGIKRGAAYIGMGNLMARFETAEAGLWNGGNLFVNGAFTHGECPSKNLIGDFQVADNIAASNRIYLHELWYRQDISNLSFIVGLQDLNVEFVASEAGANFMNSSFGIPSVIADNIPAPLFPLTALGVTAIWQVTDGINLQAAIYDGKPTDEENNYYNTNWELNSNDGALIVTESQFSFNIAGIPGTYKAGYYYHTGLKEDMGDIYGYKSIFSHNHGAYIIADNKLWEGNQGKESLNSFFQVSFSPEDINNHSYYLGGGLVYDGIFIEAGKDAAGFAFAHAGFRHNHLGNETALEMFYRYHINGNLFLQPDLQYIINPAGGDVSRDNALVLFFKTGISF